MLRNPTLPILALVTWTLLTAACGTQTSSDTQRIVHGTSYELDHAPEAVIATATTNAIIVRARVIGAQPTQTFSVPDLDQEFAFTPVNVVVTESFRGGLIPGQALTLRVLGGEVDGKSYIADYAPPREALAVGSEFMIFAQEVVTIDGIAAATPNHVYLLDDAGGMTDVSRAEVLAGASFDSARFNADLRRKLNEQPTD